MACYVPFCESVVPCKKEERRGISFHQFPSDEVVRKKWIFAIGRKDPKTGAYWDPHGSASVCGLHFSPKQFRGSKIKHLIPGSIPFIFPDYHLPERGALINQADLSSIKIIPFPNNVISENSSQQSKSVSSRSSNALETSNTNKVNSGNSSEQGKSISSQISNTCETSNMNNIDKINKAKRTFAEMISSQTESNKNKQLSCGKLKFQVKIIPASKIQKLVLSQPKNGGDFAHKASANVDLAKEGCFPVLSADSSSKMNFRATVGDSNTDASCTENVPKNTAKKHSETHNSVVSKLRIEKLHNEILAAQVLKLQEENKTLVARNRALEQKLRVYNFSELNRGVMRSDAKALFIFDQLRCFAEGKCTFTKCSLNFVKNLEKNFPECYNFLAQTDFITLPSSSDLDTDTDTDV